jgi:type 1 glutamine amidotransferase
MKRNALILALLVSIVASSFAGLPAIKLTDEWKAQITEAAPAKPTVKPSKQHKILLFSLMTGYKHWCTPHVAEVIKILGRKSGVYEVVESNEVSLFEPENIKQFDVIVLNNNCSDRKRRNLFFDVTKNDEKASMLEKSLISHIAGGKGLVSIHGSITILNNSEEYSKVLGGSFDFHPAQQEITCNLVDPDHPLVAAFNGKPLVHVDEPYLFKNAYKDKDFRPLLMMDTDKLNCGKRDAAVKSDKRYVSWIKKHGKGRVFYCSPSHNAQSYEKPELLRFLLDGIQYATGDLQCDDSPMKK